MVLVFASSGSADLLHQWDFATYYYGAKAAVAGLDPYNLAELNVANRSGTSATMPFVYHPAALLFYLPFTWFEYPLAKALNLGLSLVALFVLLHAGLTALHQLRFPHPFWLIVVCFGFHQTAGVALGSGNFVIYEAALIWLALKAYTRDRLQACALLLTVAAFFKVFPALLFSILPLHPRFREHLRFFVVLVLASAGVFSLPFVLRPDYLKGYITNALDVSHELGPFNPSSWAFVRGTLTGLEISDKWISAGVYLAWVVAVVFIYLRFVRRKQPNPRQVVFWSILVYGLIVPRLKDYAFVVFLPASQVLVSTVPASFPVFLFGGSYGALASLLLGTCLAWYWFVHKPTYDPFESGPVSGH